MSIAPLPSVAPVERFVDLLDPAANVYLSGTHADAVAAVADGDAERIAALDGQFAVVAKRGNLVRMARTIGRPMRYFLAKQATGPLLVVAERMDQLRDFLAAEGLGDQFHPSYTRMAPAHHLTEIALLGCPDPNPTLTRFFAPRRETLPADLDAIGAKYVGMLAEECDRWLERIDDREPVGVLFSGGVDSGAVLLVLHHLMLRRGRNPARLKAFTLCVDGSGADLAQARAFLDQVDLQMLLEPVEVSREQVSVADAVRVLEDYKPLDVQSATMALALCRGIRGRYPSWKLLVDGDGGDENLKDYPIEENPELTVRSVLNNTMLYQEGWGVDAIKHSLTYSGGQSRGHVRSWAPARSLGFAGFSPFALPRVIEVAEGIPFIELTGWDHQTLYALKGEVVRRGVEQVCGVTMPVFGKRRFQHGSVDDAGFADLFPADESHYRELFRQVWQR